MLDRRAQILLKTLVERYIAEGEPVGSRALSKFSGLDLSPATVRNIMADLEEMGFIASPHTSAGRVPTPRGYRFFVDTLLTVRPIDRTHLSQLEGNLHPAEPQKLKLPFAPEKPIIFREEENRPQPRLDRNSDKAMAVTVGRLRECNALDYRFVGLSHNTVRGAAGGGILNAELLKAKGFLK